MTWKEKIRICFEILFKGRDIKEELNAVYNERIKLGEKMKEQLELLINDEKPSMISSPNVSQVETIQLAEIETAPIISFGGQEYAPKPSSVKEQYFRLKIVGRDYAINEHPHYVAQEIDYTYQKVAEEFAKELIRQKLVRVETLVHPKDYYAKILRFSVNVYKGV